MSNWFIKLTGICILCLPRVSSKDGIKLLVEV